VFLLICVNVKLALFAWIVAGIGTEQVTGIGLTQIGTQRVPATGMSAASKDAGVPRSLRKSYGKEVLPVALWPTPHRKDEDIDALADLGGNSGRHALHIILLVIV